MNINKILGFDATGMLAGAVVGLVLMVLPANAQSVYEPYTFTTIAGKGGSSGSVDGTNSAARFYQPLFLVVYDTGNLYVADSENTTIRKITPVGTNWVVTTIAGKAGITGSSDGTNNSVLFNYPAGLALDSSGNIYVADFTYTIRKMTPVGTNWVVTTLAGRANSSGTNDGTGNAARFVGPAGLAVDSATNIYVADQFGDTIRKVTPVGTNWVVTTIAGKALYSGILDGTGNAARFDAPDGVIVDSVGNLYVTDTYNNTIRKGSPALAITASGPGLGFPGSGFGFNASQFGFNLTGPSGQSVVVEASADLVNWLPVWTNTLTYPTNLTFTDPRSGGQSNCFYRAVTQ